MREVNDKKKKKSGGSERLGAECTSQAKPSVSKCELSNTAVFLKILLREAKNPRKSRDFQIHSYIIRQKTNKN